MKYNDHKNLQVHCTLPFWNRSVLRTLTWIVNVFGITCLSTKLFFARLLWLVHGSVKGNKQGFVANVIDQNRLLNVLAHKSFQTYLPCCQRKDLLPRSPTYWEVLWWGHVKPEERGQHFSGWNGRPGKRNTWGHRPPQQRLHPRPKESKETQRIPEDRAD